MRDRERGWRGIDRGGQTERARGTDRDREKERDRVRKREKRDRERDRERQRDRERMECVMADFPCYGLDQVDSILFNEQLALHKPHCRGLGAMASGVQLRLRGLLHHKSGDP